MEAYKSKEFKTIDGRVIVCRVTDSNVNMYCAGFTATYKRTEVNDLLDLHSKILNAKTIKEIRNFINNATEPEQLSLF